MSLGNVYIHLISWMFANLNAPVSDTADMQKLQFFDSWISFKNC